MFLIFNLLFPLKKRDVLHSTEFSIKPGIGIHVKVVKNNILTVKEEERVRKENKNKQEGDY